MATGNGRDRSYSQGFQTYNGHQNTVNGQRHTVIGASSSWGGQSSVPLGGQSSGKQALNSYSYGHNYTGQSMGGGHTYTGQSIGGGHSHNGHSPGGSYMFNGQSQTYLYNGQPASCYSNNGHNSHNGQPHYQWTGHTSGHSIGWALLMEV